MINYSRESKEQDPAVLYDGFMKGIFIVDMEDLVNINSEPLRIIDIWNYIALKNVNESYVSLQEKLKAKTKGNERKLMEALGANPKTIEVVMGANYSADEMCMFARNSINLTLEQCQWIAKYDLEMMEIELICKSFAYGMGQQDFEDIIDNLTLKKLYERSLEWQCRTYGIPEDIMKIILGNYRF